MKQLIVIGIGTGNLEHITIQAIRALNRVDVFFVADKGEEKADLVALRHAICARYIEGRAYRTVELRDPVRDANIANYDERVAKWHAQRAALYEEAFANELREGQVGGLLVWGDPSIYDSTLRILELVKERGAVALEYEVIPGISAVHVLAARHRISLHEIGAPIHITTGRQLARARRMPDSGDLVVMLDGECAFKTLEDPSLEIYWGAYLGSSHERLVSGTLGDKAEEIERVRAEARAEHGWIMDTYLLRRPRSNRFATRER